MTSIVLNSIYKVSKSWSPQMLSVVSCFLRVYLSLYRLKATHHLFELFHVCNDTAFLYRGRSQHRRIVVTIVETVTLWFRPTCAEQGRFTWAVQQIVTSRHISLPRSDGSFVVASVKLTRDRDWVCTHRFSHASFQFWLGSVGRILDFSIRRSSS